MEEQTKPGAEGTPTVGALVRAERERRGLSRRELARLARRHARGSVTVRQIRELENAGNDVGEVPDRVLIGVVEALNPEIVEAMQAAGLLPSWTHGTPKKRGRARAKDGSSAWETLDRFLAEEREKTDRLFAELKADSTCLDEYLAEEREKMDRPFPRPRQSLRGANRS